MLIVLTICILVIVAVTGWMVYQAPVDDKDDEDDQRMRRRRL